MSLAASIVQFIDFGHKLLSESSDLYHLGKSVRHADLEIVFRDLKEVTNSLQTRPGNAPSRQLTVDEQVGGFSAIYYT